MSTETVRPPPVEHRGKSQDGIDQQTEHYETNRKGELAAKGRALQQALTEVERLQRIIAGDRCSCDAGLLTDVERHTIYCSYRRAMEAND